MAAAAREAGRPRVVWSTAGIITVGHEGNGFCFDNETPRHDELIPEVRIARHLVSNAEWLEFIAAGGYDTPSLWLSDGWLVQAEGWQAPGYWRQHDGGWHAMTLGGLKPVDPAAPVTHISYYEAEAFARFAGKHLPSEAEWEVAAGAGVRRRLRHRLAMDAQRLSRPIQATARPKGRSANTTEVHGQPDGVARLIAGNAGGPCAHQLSQFFLSAGALAIQRAAARRIRLRSSNGRARTFPRTAQNIEASAFEADVLAGLNATPKRVPAKYFYDGTGSRYSSASPNCPNTIRRAAK